MYKTLSIIASVISILAIIAACSLGWENLYLRVELHDAREKTNFVENQRDHARELLARYREGRVS